MLKYNINMTRAKTAASKDNGMVSLMVVGVITILMALITIGFSRIMDRELRQSLDRDLSTQAYYAAESGLNDARAFVNAVKDNPPNINPNQCIDPNAYPQYFASSGDISGDGNVKYPCVLVDFHPPDLVYTINAGHSAVFQAQSQTGGSPRELYISWENFGATGYAPLGSCSGNSCQLPEENTLGTDTTGMLRVTVYPVFGGGYGGNTDGKLAQDSRTYFLYPNGGSGTVGSDSYSSNGTFIQGNCNAGTHPNLPYGGSVARYCNSKITGLPAGAQSLYVHVSALYKNESISVQGTNPSGVVRFSGAEAAVDVTGEGNDVLHRVRAHIPYNNQYDYPEATTSMQTLCKRFRIPKIGPNDWGTAYTDDPTGDSACFLDSGATPAPSPSPSPSPSPTPPPPPPSSGCTPSQTVGVQHTRLLFNGGPTSYRIDPDPPLRACGKTYSFIVRTWDESHPERFPEDQLNEQVFIEGYTSGGSLVFRTTPTIDIPHTATAQITTYNNVSIPQDVSIMYVKHCSIYPDDPAEAARCKTGPVRADWSNSVHGVDVTITPNP